MRKRNFVRINPVIPLIFWILLFLLIIFVPPANIFSILPFYLLLSGAIFTSFLVLKLDPRLALLTTSALIGYLFIRQLKVDNFITLILLISTFAVGRFYLLK